MPLHWERIMGRLIAILLLFVFSLVWCLPADTAKAQDSLSGMPDHTTENTWFLRFFWVRWRMTPAYIVNLAVVIVLAEKEGSEQSPQKTTVFARIIAP